MDTNARMEKIQKLIAYWQVHQRDAEMKVLVFAHEVDRLTDELAVYETILKLAELSEHLGTVTADIKATIEGIADAPQ